MAAAAEERFTGEKTTGTFPVNAMNYCLQAAKLTPDNVDYLGHGFCYEPYKSFYELSENAARQYEEVFSRKAQLQCLQDYFPSINWDDKFIQVPHHLAHAASTFYPSGFEESLILITDGMGEQHNTTIALGRGNQIEIIKQIPGLHSIGILYGVMTMYLGFFFLMDEYKVMGLAAFGNPNRYFNKMADLVKLEDDGTYTIPILYKNRTELEKETYAGSLAILSEMFGPPREPDDDVTTHHMDVAAALQAVLQNCLLHVLRYFQKETGQKNLCMAGGVALNCTANAIIKRSRLFREIFIQPAAGDDGTALGAALFIRHQRVSNQPAKRMRLPLWGPGYNEAQIESVVKNCSTYAYTRFASLDELFGKTAALLAKGQIVAWFQGRMEFGPRALGSRSILGDPRDKEMRNRINQRIKKREDFRPFGPAVINEEASRYFDIETGDEASYSYMLSLTQVKTDYQDRLPAVTHIDGSARVQCVSKQDQPRFWELLKTFGKISGVPVLLNTSLNVQGQPIVNSPEEALATFLSAKLDALVMENFLLVRRDVYNKFSEREDERR
jgi:carbamoyltransferase